MKHIFADAIIYDACSASFVRGSLLCVDGKVADVVPEGQSLPDADLVTRISFGSALLPGFVDVHTHGRCGFDFNTADAGGLRTMARSYALDGTTTVMPTLASAPFDELCASAALIRSARGREGGAAFRGIHLEGRYLEPSKRGAHDPALLTPPDAGELSVFLRSSGLPLHVSAALELDADGSFARTAKEGGATLGLGHTAATYEQALGLLRAHGVSFTHLYNCMPSLHHRDGGPVLCALKDGGFCELICDGLHVSAPVVAFTYGCVTSSRLCLVSDSMAATASPDGDYILAGSPCTVRDGRALTLDGRLAGSTLTLRTAVENLAAFTGKSICEVLPCATLNPAKECGLDAECGSLSPGRSADIIVCRPDFGGGKIDIRGVYVRGEEIK